jgi:hypothetical protein
MTLTPPPGTEPQVWLPDLEAHEQKINTIYSNILIDIQYIDNINDYFSILMLSPGFFWALLLQMD